MGVQANRDLGQCSGLLRSRCLQPLHCATDAHYCRHREGPQRDTRGPNPTHSLCRCDTSLSPLPPPPPRLLAVCCLKLTFYTFERAKETS